MNNKKITLLLAIIIFASSWVLFKPGFFRAHDYIHAARVAEMTRALSEGQFPVRWSANFGYGYGMPLFLFYAPLPYYVGTLFFWLGVPIILTLKILIFISSAVSAIGAYLLGKKLFSDSDKAGIITAAAFTLAPYRAVNIFVRGALGEAWGMMCLPWVLYGLVLLGKRKEKHGLQILIFSLAALILSHNLTAMMFIPLSIIFGAWYYWVSLKPSKTKKKKFFHLTLKTAGAYFLALGLTAFYVFPAFFEKGFTKVESIFSGYFHYSHHFLYIRQFFKVNWGYGGSAWGPDDEISFFLGIGQLIGLAVGIVFFVSWAWKKNKKNRLKILDLFSTKALLLPLLGLMGISLYLSLQRALPIWEVVPGLGFIQFPWRWLSAASLFLALIVGLSVNFLPKDKTRWIYSWVLLTVIVLGNFWFFQPEKFLDDPDSLYYTDADRIQREMSGILPDYIPAGVAEEAELLATTYQLPVDDVEYLVNRGHEKLFRVNFDSTSNFELQVAAFPGWEVELDGQPHVWNASSLGLVETQVPAGEHLLGVRLGKTPIRHVSDAVSILAVLVLFWYLLKGEKYKKLSK